MKPTFFANGGDIGRTNTPEQAVCEELGIELQWSIGGDEKLDSSSELAKKARDFQIPEQRSKTLALIDNIALYTMMDNTKTLKLDSSFRPIEGD